MTRQALAPDEAHAVWDLLVAKAGANEDERGEFCRYLTDSEVMWHEYRFCGLLAFGGKLHYNGHQSPSVSCYREDRDEVRDAIIAAVNEELARIAHRAVSDRAACVVARQNHSGER